MIKETFLYLYERDLLKVIEEIKLYKSEEDLWKLSEGITNSGGNLALHLIGNINHFFGANLGNTGYQRERDLEFSRQNIAKKEIVENLENAIVVFKETMKKLTDEDFHKDYPEKLGGETQKTFGVILFMLSHLNYHLGQINYHRRLLLT